MPFTHDFENPHTGRALVIQLNDSNDINVFKYFDFRIGRRRLFEYNS